VEFIHYIFEDYSRRGLTEKTDRCVAAFGLEARIAGAVECESRYGIFQVYLHQNLLWQASDDKMERIAYDNNQQVPSWSWMAYSGGIRFKDIEVGSIDWVVTLRFDEERKSALITDVGKFRNCTLKSDGDHYIILNFVRRKKGWIRYDVKNAENFRQERCVVVGKTTKRGGEEYCVLVVVPTNVDGEYRRVGVGMIRCGYLERWRLNVRVV
jgi:hypothetical protein